MIEKIGSKASKLLGDFMRSYGLAPIDLATRLSPPVAQQTVIRWRDGSRRPSIDYQKQLQQISDKKIILSSWKTDEEIRQEKARAAWLKAHPAQSGGKRRERVENGVAAVAADGKGAGSSGKTNRENTSSEHSASRSDTNNPSAGLHSGSPRPHLQPTEKAAACPRGRPRGSRTRVEANSETRNGGHSDDSSAPGDGPAGDSRGIATGDSIGVVAGVESSADGSKKIGEMVEAGRPREVASATRSENAPIGGQNYEDIKAADFSGVANFASVATVASNSKSVGSHSPYQTNPRPSRIDLIRSAHKASARLAAKPVTPAAETAKPLRKSHAECSPDDPMARLQLARSGGIQFELVDEQGVVLECYTNVVDARNALDSRVHPTSYAARCKFCWTEVSVYTPPNPEVTERLVRAVSGEHPSRASHEQASNG